MIPKSAIAANVARDLGWPLLQAEAAIDRWADAHGVAWAGGWRGNPSMSEGSAEACIADLAGQKEADERADIRAAIIASAEGPRGVRQPSPRERMELLGGVEHATKIIADQSIPLNPVRVVSQAEQDAMREEIIAKQVPGVAYRVPNDRPTPGETVHGLRSAKVRAWLAEDRLSPWDS